MPQESPALREPRGRQVQRARQVQRGQGLLPERQEPELPVWPRQALARRREQQGRQPVWLPERRGRPQPLRVNLTGIGS